MKVTQAMEALSWTVRRRLQQLVLHGSSRCSQGLQIQRSREVTQSSPTPSESSEPHAVSSMRFNGHIKQ